jgi:FKBP-type peptidyl-prolyl cis-trans isomerase FkpA
MNKKKILILLFPVIALWGCLNDDAWEEQQAQQKRIVEQMVADTVLIVNYLDSLNLEASKHESWLYYSIIDSGVAPYPNGYSMVKVHYKASLLNGTVFDDNTDKEPSQFWLSNLIAGWQIGLPLIGKTGKIILYIPSYWGYGTASSTKIPANSVLIFEIELIDVL